MVWASGALAASPGQAVYERSCTPCHGADGKGALPGVPALGGKAGRLAKPDAVLLKNMIQGYRSPGSPMPMPAKGGDPWVSGGSSSSDPVERPKRMNIGIGDYAMRGVLR